MKITNVFGTEFTGTIGDMITASNWKGRNYIKRYFIPSNPNSAQQQVVRDHWKNGVTKWQGLAADEKGAYGHKARYDKRQITAFNTLMASYMDIVLAGGAFVDPSAGMILVEDSVTTNPIEGALIVVKKAGQSTEYMRNYSPVDGEIDDGLCAEDQNYDYTISAPGYTSQTFLNQTAVLVFAGQTVALVAIP